MMNRTCGVWVGFLICALFSSQTRAENWPGWRGPRGDGTSSVRNLPQTWDGESGENIRWKSRIPGTGYSSPVVWDETIFLTSCLESTGDRVLMALDRRTGTVEWQQTVLTCPLETKHKLNSHASGTPATDGERVYVTFLEVDGRMIDAPNVGRSRLITPGTMVVAAYDFTGKQLWMTRPGPFVSAHGYSSCPVLFEDLVIVNGDHDGDSYIVALDKQSGKTVWKVPRVHRTRSYVTPIIREIDGRTQMVFSGSHRIVSLDPRDGTMHWQIEGPTEQFVASMVYDNRQFYMAAGFPTYHVMAIRPDGTGDVTETHVAWHVTDAKCYVPSPVVVDGLLLVANDHGIGNCFDVETGERLWRARLGRHFSASLVTAEGLVYFPADDGKVTVLKPGRDAPTTIAENLIPEDLYASPAIAHGNLFLRGTEHLYCIGSTDR